MKRRLSHVAIDTETPGLDAKRGLRPYAVTLCTDKGDAYYFGLPSWKIDPHTRKVTPVEKDIRQIKKILDAHDRIVMHNAVFDVTFLRTIGIDLTSRWPDIENTQLASHVLDSRDGKHKLKPAANRYLGIPEDDESILRQVTIEARKIAKERGWPLADDIEADYWMPALIFPKDSSLEAYATTDAERTILLWLKVFGPQLIEEKLWEQYQKHKQVMPVIHDMQDHGITLRPSKLKTETVRISQLQFEAMNKALDLVPPTICENINSGPQLGRALHDHFKLPILYKTASGAPATDAKTLEDLVKITPKNSKAGRFLDFVLFAKKAATAETYLRNYADHAIVIDGVTYLFPSINQTGTATTRVSGSNPNPQNVSKGKETDPDTKTVDFKLRSVFGPRRNRIWYAIDYDQLQLRIFAQASGEERMVQAFRDGYDFHTWMGCEIYKVAPDQLTKLQRRVAKNVNFGYIFGAGPKKIDETSGVKGLSKKLAKMFPAVDDFMARTISFVRQHGYVYTLGGYRLSVEKSRAYSGVCILVQGTEGEIVKDAMVRVHSYIQPFGDDFYMSLQVHDELLFDAAKATKKDHQPILKTIKAEMEAAGDAVGVTTPANCEVIVENWADSSKLAL